VATVRRGLLPRSFFGAASFEVAPALLGCVIEHETEDGIVGVRLTEVEAYHGGADPASHAFRGRTRRNEVLFGDPGFVYVYFTYGMHYCMNLVCAPAGTASAVLLRAGEVVDGVELATSRRGDAAFRDLARGPARLTTALGIGRPDNGRDACDPCSPLRVRPAKVLPAGTGRQGPRVGVAAAAVMPWRVWLDGEPTVSSYRRHVPRRRPANRSTARACDTQGSGA
jgi:DNA-3-methyladenine glycosylase